MTSPDPRDRPGAAAPAAHARHDTFLVAAHAAGDLSGASESAAETQIATCTACAALYDDLRAITGATQSLSNVTIPASASGRDFRLTREQAARLDRGRGWRRLLAPLAGRGAGWIQPLAMGMTTLGLAGVLLATVLPGIGGLASGGAAASAAAPERFTTQAAATAAPAPAPGGVPQPGGAPDTSAPEGGAGAVGITSAPSGAVDAFSPTVKASPELPTSETAGRNSGGSSAAPPDAQTPLQEGSPQYAGGGPASNAQDGVTHELIEERPSPISLLGFGSAVLIVVGLVLFGLRLVARRLA